MGAAARSSAAKGDKPTITGFRLTAPGQAEIEWTGATTGVFVESSTSLAFPRWRRLPGVPWPVHGSKWTGPIPVTDGQLFLRLAVSHPAARANLTIHDAGKQDAGYPAELTRIHPNPSDQTAIEYLGRAHRGKASFGRGYRLVNAGSTPLAVHAIELASSGTNLVLTLPNPGQTLPVEIQSGARFDVRVTATTDTPGLHLGRLEVVSDDPQAPVYAFNVAAAIGEPETLLCSGDNDNWVDPAFTCAGKPDGTLCGGTDDGKSRVCNQGACVLLGDANDDGRVDRRDIVAYLEDVGDGRPNLAIDFDCDGTANGDARERQMLANLLADTGNFEAYNSRAVESCLGRV